MRGVIETVAVGAEDWRAWRALRLAALAQAPDAFGSTLAQWTGAGDQEARWRARLADVALNLILRRDGHDVAMASGAVLGDPTTVELISLWVAPAARGRGVGDAAVQGVVDWARRQHPGADVILSVRSANVVAVRLYQRHGFVDVGASPDDPSERLMRQRRL